MVTVIEVIDGCTGREVWGEFVGFEDPAVLILLNAHGYGSLFAVSSEVSSVVSGEVVLGKAEEIDPRRSGTEMVCQRRDVYLKELTLDTGWEILI